MFSFNPEIPGDGEKQKAEMERKYRKTYGDLVMKGVRSVGPVPGSLVMNACVVRRGVGE